jgi:hypothetical protein
MAQKKKPQIKKDVRGHEGTKFDVNANFQDSQSAAAAKETGETLTSSIKDQELYNTGATISEDA